MQHSRLFDGILRACLFAFATRVFGANRIEDLELRWNKVQFFRTIFTNTMTFPLARSTDFVGLGYIKDNRLSWEVFR
jgi:hypothetical protein